MMSLTKEQIQSHLGYVPGPGELFWKSVSAFPGKSVSARERGAWASCLFLRSGILAQKEGRNFISSVKYQGLPQFLRRLCNSRDDRCEDAHQLMSQLLIRVAGWCRNSRRRVVLIAAALGAVMPVDRLHRR